MPEKPVFDLDEILTLAIDIRLNAVGIVLHSTTVERVVDAVMETLAKEGLIENV